MAWVTSGKVTSGNHYHDFPAGTFAAGGTYQWQVLTYDSSGAVSAWSAIGTFTAIVPTNVSAMVGGGMVKSNRYVWTGSAWARHNPVAK